MKVLSEEEFKHHLTVSSDLSRSCCLISHEKLRELLNLALNTLGYYSNSNDIQINTDFELVEGENQKFGTKAKETMLNIYRKAVTGE